MYACSAILPRSSKKTVSMGCYPAMCCDENGTYIHPDGRNNAFIKVLFKVQC